MIARALRFLLSLTALLLIGVTTHAATFPGNARLTIADTGDRALTWHNPTQALTVSFWFRITQPSDVPLSSNMMIVADRADGTWSGSQLAQNHAYAVYLDAATGKIDFSTRGTGGYYSNTLIAQPYIERWYHVAIVRSSGTNLIGYVDGRVVFNTTVSVGDTKPSDTTTVSIGGFTSGFYLRGEVQEMAVYRAQIFQGFISDHLFTEIPPNTAGLTGYYKLAFPTVAGDDLKNFATNPGPPALPGAAVQAGASPATFEETDRAGEQSLFDFRKNEGRDAVAALSGVFTWEQSVFQRNTVGVPFEFAIGYSSGNAFNFNSFGNSDPFLSSPLGSGWRHSFDARVVPSNDFQPIGTTDVIGVLSWDGSLEVWKSADDVNFTTRHGEYRGEVRKIGGGASAVIEWTTPDRIIYRFHTPFTALAGQNAMHGRLLQVRDLNGNAMNLAWDTSVGRVTQVTDSGAGQWNFAYDSGTGRLQSVTGLGWTANFTYATVTVGGVPKTVLSTKSITPPNTATYPMPVVNAQGGQGSTQWQFFYDGSARLNRIADPRGNNDIQIAYDSFGRKVSEQDANGRWATFKYNVPALRQLTATDHFNTGGGNPASSPNDRILVETFDRKLRTLSRKDPLGFLTNYEYDAAGNVTAATDARGNRSTMTYDSRSNILSTSNALGQTSTFEYGHILTGGIPLNKPTKETRPATAEAPSGWKNRYTYDGAGNLLTHTDDLDPLATHTYGPRGLVSSSKDARDNVTTFSYDPVTGFLTSRTIPGALPMAQRTWNFTHTELGWPKTETNPLNHTTTLGYNVNGQVISTTDAISRTFTKAYDSNGNLVVESDGKGVNATYTYDAADQRFQKRDRPVPGSPPTGFLWQFAHNPFGELETTTAPPAVSDGSNQSLVSTRIYDLNGRVIEDRDAYYPTTPAGHFTRYEYDANGNPTATVDKVGKRWEKTYDALNRVIAERDPEGNVRRTSFDAAGRVLVITSPNGTPTSHEYDGRGRLAKWKDPEGFEWEYRYDGVGNIEKIIDAEDGEYVMTYGPRNERLTERNQDNKQWSYTYDALIRLATQANPPGTGAGPGGGPVLRTLSYDPVGRLESVEFNTGRINSLGYDDNNNVRFLTRTRPGQPTTTLQLDYDAMDRLTESRDTFSKTVRYGYDALSRVVTKTYPGGKILTHGYDKLSRLTALSFTGVAQPCTFAYDDAGRLIGRTYPNGITQTNTFDDAGRIENLGYTGTATPHIALAYAYDRNGNKTGGTENGTLSWQKNSLADYDETAAFKPDGKLISRTDALSPRDFTYAYDDAGNLTTTTGGDDSYDLTYDEDNRTTSITWHMGIMADKVITNRYDALGRRVSRISTEPPGQATPETRYVLDLMGGMERILCDTDAAGVIKAWYIHGPDLCFKVTDTGALTCYHADAQGNIVRTTNATGATINQYAYTPYGRAIDTNPVSAITDPSDPYRFVGSQGVMLEFPTIASSNLYFMRARYYSAEAAVFFATDPVKNIGPGWKPEAYGYANQTPTAKFDPTGNAAVAFFAKGYVMGLGREFIGDLGPEGLQGIGLTRQDSEFVTNLFDDSLDAGGMAIDANWLIRNSAAKGPALAALALETGGEAWGSMAYRFGKVVRDASNKYLWDPAGKELGYLLGVNKGNAHAQAPPGSPKTLVTPSDAGKYAETVNGQQATKPTGPTEIRKELRKLLKQLIGKYEDEIESIEEKIDRLKAKIRRYEEQGKDTSKYDKQLSDAKKKRKGLKDKLKKAKTDLKNL